MCKQKTGNLKKKKGERNIGLKRGIKGQRENLGVQMNGSYRTVPIQIQQNFMNIY